MIFFSPSVVSFYDDDFKDQYEAANNWPEDLVEIDPATRDGFVTSVPAGKVLGVVDGTAGWVDAPPQTPRAQAATDLAIRIGQGITLTSASNPSLDGVYALDSESTSQIFNIGLYANQFGVFPSGAVQAYPDKDGTPHMFSVAEFVAFLRVIAPLVSNLNTQAQIAGNGGEATWPDQTASI